MKKRTKDSPVLASLIDGLRREKKPIWKRVAQELSRSSRQRAEVNLSKLSAYAEDGATVLVPGKVLGSGTLSKKLNVAAYSFSGTARKLITESGGKTMSIDGLCKANPEGKGVLLLK